MSMSRRVRVGVAAFAVVAGSAGVMASPVGTASALLSNCVRYDYALQTGSNCFAGEGAHRARQVCNQPSGAYWQYGSWLNRTNQSNTGACYGASISQRAIQLS
jgi:hypothetical protein